MESYAIRRRAGALSPSFFFLNNDRTAEVSFNGEIMGEIQGGIRDRRVAEEDRRGNGETRVSSRTA